MAKGPSIPIFELERLATEYGATEVIVLARFPSADPASDLTTANVVTYGQTDEQAGFAAIAGRQIGAVIDAQPRSLEDALEVASKIRPKDVIVGNQCPECGSTDTASCLTTPGWWRCPNCLHEWEEDDRP